MHLKGLRSPPFELTLVPMTIHPVIDKVFQYGSGGVEQLLQEHQTWELKRVWETEVSSALRQRFKEVHQGQDFYLVLRLLSTKSLLKVAEECLSEDIDDRRRKQLVKHLCEQVRLFGRAKTLTIKAFLQA